MSQLISKEKFVKNMNYANYLHKLIDQNHKSIRDIYHHFKLNFPNKVNEITHYMFELDFGKCGDEFIEPEDFYEQLIK